MQQSLTNPRQVGIPEVRARLHIYERSQACRVEPRRAATYARTRALLNGHAFVLLGAAETSVVLAFRGGGRGGAS